MNRPDALRHNRVSCPSLNAPLISTFATRSSSNLPLMQEVSYFDSRMTALGVNDSNNSITVRNEEAEFPQPSQYTTPIFTEDKSTGDIEILYYRINGELITYEQVSDSKTGHINAKSKIYKTRRLKEPKGDMKYVLPSGQETLPWFPPALVAKYNAMEQVPTLILTEGVFKAMCGSIAGLDVVGLASITCYKQRNGKLYDDIALLIERCNVQNIVIMWDADCLNISKKDLQTGDDITNRPNTFFYSAKKISELISKLNFAKTRETPSVYFSHPRYDALPQKPKGLDDIIIAGREAGREARIVQEAAKPWDEQFFFYSQNIKNGTASLQRYFRLDSAEKFYDFHCAQIESREFKFKGSIYKYSESKEELEMQAPEWANRVKWVGDEFFLDDVVPGAYGDIRRLISYKQGQFSKMFGNDFWQYLQHHRAFVNIPDHFTYQQILEKEDGAKYYNRYFPFPHVPQEGNWDTIKELLLHLFGTTPIKHAITGKEYQPIDLALDYIQLLLTKPTQMLPILCFYSPENNTGKSTFGKLMMALFGDNAVPIGNNELQSEFNDVFVDKLLAVCEETLLERKRDAERLKALSTSEKVTVNPKGQKQFTIDFFCKFIFTSNNLRMIYVSKHDQRYWIIQVPVIKKENPNMLEEMKAELPALVAYLKTRELSTPKEGRMWFHHSLIHTRVLDNMVRVNEPTDATNLRENIREWFMMDKELKEIQMTMKEIKEEFFNSKTSSAWISEIMKDYLCVDLLRDITGEAVFKRGYYSKYEAQFSQETKAEEIVLVQKPFRGRPYVFRREHFISENEVKYPDPGIQTTLELPPAPPPQHKKVIEGAMQEASPGDEAPF